MQIRITIANVFLFILACATACGNDRKPAKNAIVLASVYNTGGAQAVLDGPSSNGSVLATSEVNANGGVSGRMLSLVPVNGNSVPDALAADIEELLDHNADIVALFGLSDTDMVRAAAPVAASHKRVFLTSGATSPKLPEHVPEYLFLACFGDNVQAAAGAEWAYGHLGARKVQVLFDPNESYTQLLRGYFIERFEALGGTTTETDNINPRVGLVMLPTIGDVDLVFLAVETAEDAARVIPILRDSGYAGPILGGDGFDSESTWEDAPDVSDVYFTTHVYLGADSPNPRVSSFVKAYAAAYPGQAPSAFAALGYDAVKLLAAAFERAGDATPEAVAKGLSGLQDYAGVTGTISFPNGHRIPTKSVTILRIADAKQVFVAEVIPEHVPNP